MQYPEVLNNDQLIPDKYYWVTSKPRRIENIEVEKEPEKKPFYICRVSEDVEGRKAVMFSDMPMWCYEGNSQFLERYRAYGPIVEPNIFDEKPGLNEVIGQQLQGSDTCKIEFLDLVGDVRQVSISITTSSTRSWTDVLYLILKQFTLLVSLKKDK